MTRITAPIIRSRKGGKKLVALTCYSTPMAQLLDPLVDILLVGDSIGMVLYGMESTIGVSLPMMVAHTEAVKRGSTQAFLLADLPFGSYQSSPRDAFLAAAELLKAGAQGVKLEGGMEMFDTVQFLVERGVPVMAHIGLKPQYVQTQGGYKKQGKTEEARAQMLLEAKVLEKAGAFALLVEGTEEGTARAITEAATIPTIGIGASPACDGQVLVTEDLLGITANPPSFVKPQAQLAKEISAAVERFTQLIRNV
jgi:3-methyl-2-oxobutanoate hydroxymethyltransferase